MSDNSSKNKVIAKNTVLLGIRMVIVMCIALYVSRITLENLGVVDFGIYNVVCGFVSMFTFVNLAMTTGIQRFYNFEFGKDGETGANRVFVTSIYSQIVLSILIVILIEPIGLWYLHNKMVIPIDRMNAASWIFQISILSMVIMMMQVPFDAAILAHERMNLYAFISIMNQVLKLIIVLSLPLFSSDKLVVYGLLYLLVTIIGVAISIIYSKRNFAEIRLSRIFYKQQFYSILSFSGWNIIGKFACIMKEQGVNMVLNLFFGPIVNAARALAFQVTGALNGFVSNISVAVKPQMTQSYAQGDYNRTFNLVFTASKLSFFTLFILSLPVCLEIDYILRLWLGAGNVPQYTNTFIILVIVAALVGTLNTQLSFLVHATGVMKKYQIVTSLVELVVVPLSYVVLKMGAHPGSVFIILFVITCISLFVSLLIVKGIVDISVKKYLIDIVFRLGLMTLTASVIPIVLRIYLSYGIIRVIVVFIVSFVFTIFSFYVIGLNNKEKQLFKQYMYNFINRIK